MQDRFEDLRTFIAIAQTGKLGAAADRLGIVRSAVSRRLQELEERLGVQLVVRNTRHLALTEAGGEYFERAQSILDDLEQAEAVLSRRAGKPGGKLRISAPVSWSVMHLAPLMAEFVGRYPEIAPELVLSDRLVDLVEDGFDVALRISRLKDSTLIARQIAPIRHVVCAAPGYLRRHGTPKSPQDLRRHRGLGYLHVDDRDYWKLRDPDSGEALTVEVPTVARANNGDALREMAMSGLGIAHLPTFIVCDAVRTGKLSTVLLDYMRLPIHLYAVYPSRRHLPERVRVLVEFLIEKFGAEPAWDRMLVRGRAKRD